MYQFYSIFFYRLTGSNRCEKNECSGCQDGIPADPCPEHGGKDCGSCDPGFVLHDMNPGSYSNQYMACIDYCFCTNGPRFYNCPIPGLDLCESCYAGYALTVDGKCEAECVCTNGTPMEPCPASASPCYSWGRCEFHHCETCEIGYVKQAITIPAGNFPDNLNFHGESYVEDKCLPVPCNCANGEGTTPCPQNDNNHCSTCDAGYHIQTSFLLEKVRD